MMLAMIALWMLALTVNAQFQADGFAVQAEDIQVFEGPLPAVQLVAEVEGPEAPIENTNDNTPAEADETPTPIPAAEPVPPGTLRFHLMDGTIITGKLETQSIAIKTEFGDLVVPLESIQSFSPGLGSLQKIDAKINALIDQLGSPEAAQRDKAQAQLIEYGAGLVAELQKHANDPDAERRIRIASITEELLSSKDDFGDEESVQISLLRNDSIVTEDFTIAGKIQQQKFNIRSKFGSLEVNLEDIKTAQTVTSEKPEIRKAVDVQGSDFAGMKYKNTGIKLKRGDRVNITADGRITLTPWGNNSVSTPDGVAQNGMYNATVPFGGLAGRVGESGEEFMVGSKCSFVAKNAGTLYLGFAMQQNWANYQFPGKYETKIRVIPAP